MRNIFRLPTADDSYLNTRDYYDGILPPMLYHDMNKWKFVESYKMDSFNTMCYVIEMLDRGIILPFKLIYITAEFLEYYLNSDDLYKDWTIPEEVYSAYSIVLKKLKELLKEELGEDSLENHNFAWKHGSIYAKDFLSDIENEKYMHDTIDQEAEKNKNGMNKGVQPLF